MVGTSFANLPISHANSLFSQLSVPASQPAQPQTQPTVAQTSNPPAHDAPNTSLENKPDTVSEIQNRKPGAANYQQVKTDPRLNTHEERSTPNPQVKFSKLCCCFFFFFFLPNMWLIITLLT